MFGSNGDDEIKETAEEDLDTNVFYKALRTVFTREYNSLGQTGGIAAIPHSALLYNVRITSNLISHHILRPSRLYIGQYISLAGKTLKEDTANGILELLGENTRRTARILYSEEVYTSQRSFRVVVIDTILADEVESTSSSRSGPISGSIPTNPVLSHLPTRPSLAASTELLLADPVGVIVAKNVLEKPRLFIRSYVFVPGLERAAALRVGEFVADAFDAFVCACPDFRMIVRHPRQELRLRLAVSTFIVGHCHQRLWSTLCDGFGTQDSSLLASFKAANTARNPPEITLSLRKDLIPRVESASKFLADLDGEKSSAPTEMLLAVKDTIDAYLTPGGEALAGDDALPALACALIKACPEHAAASLFYMQNFIYCDLSTSPLGYALATYTAALELIKTTYKPPQTTAAAISPVVPTLPEATITPTSPTKSRTMFYQSSASDVILPRTSASDELLTRSSGGTGAAHMRQRVARDKQATIAGLPRTGHEKPERAPVVIPLPEEGTRRGRVPSDGDVGRGTREEGTEEKPSGGGFLARLKETQGTVDRHTFSSSGEVNRRNSTLFY